MIINFGWLIENRIAGFGQPGGIHWEQDPVELANDFEHLFQLGIRALVSLTEIPLDESVFGKFAYLHLPIADMRAPTLDEVAFFMEFVEKMENQNKPLGVHCRAGLGRTGTMLACYLVHMGESPQDAVEHVRRKRPGAIETLEQETAITSYAQSLKKQQSNDLYMNLN